jgi:hypothetical protein
MALDQKMFAKVSGVIFLLIALLHLVRVLSAGPVYLAGWVVPMWPSWIALIVAGYLAYNGFRLAK